MCELTRAAGPSSGAGSASCAGAASAGAASCFGAAAPALRRRLGWLALGDGGAAGIDDLHPAVLVGERILLVLELLLAEADHRKPAFIDLVGLDQEGLHRRRTALRQRKIVLVAALGVGMAGDQEGCRL